MTQKELAAKAYLHVDTVRKYENGQNCPRLDVAASVARALGVAIDALIKKEKGEKSDV
jgi:DNA-binding XRE family transcriptional regulator